MFNNLRIDLQSFCDGSVSFKKFIFLFFVSTDFKAVLYYRISSWCYRNKLKYLSYYLRNLAKKRYGVDLSPMACIGPGLRLFHSLGTVIGNNVVIGLYCTVYQQVTIGTSSVQMNKVAYPRIGNHVIIYAGAKILGDIHIGDHSVVAANAVVITNVKPYSIVGGIPAKVLKEIGRTNDKE